MALFAQSNIWLQERLRLSSVPASSTDTLAIFTDAIEDARLAFFRRLGADRVSALLAITDVPAPVTNDENLRCLANRVELWLVKVRLLRDLPSAFMDASGDLQRRWNEEAPFREMPSSDREREIARINEDIEQSMQLLAGTESVGEEFNVYTYDGTPEETPPLPGDTLLPWYNSRRLSND
jgi:hypothetical protein